MISPLKADNATKTRCVWLWIHCGIRPVPLAPKAHPAASPSSPVAATLAAGHIHVGQYSGHMEMDIDKDE